MLVASVKWTMLADRRNVVRGMMCASSRWVFQNSNSVSDCTSNCANNCGNNAQNNAALRSGLFGSVGSWVKGVCDFITHRGISFASLQGQSGFHFSDMLDVISVSVPDTSRRGDLPATLV